MKKVTLLNLRKAKEIYKKLKKWNFANQQITEYFNNHRNDFSDLDIIIKICLVDSLYKTNLRNQVELTKHIIKHKDTLKKLLTKGDTSAIHTVASFTLSDGKEKYLLSFASKFCHFHNKSKFPIFDKYVGIALNNIVSPNLFDSQKRSQKMLELFMDSIDIIKKENDNIDYEVLDTYLWLYGQKVYYDKYKKNNKNPQLNKEVLELLNKESQLFEQLVPIE